MIMLILTKLIMFLFWFSLGFYWYKELLSDNSKIKILINRLSFFELFITIFTIITILQLIDYLVLDYLNSFYAINHEFSCFAGQDGNSYIIDGIDDIPSTSGHSGNAESSSGNSASSSSSNPSSQQATTQSSQSTGSSGSSPVSTGGKGKEGLRSGVDGVIMSTAIAGAAKIALRSAHPNIGGKAAIMAGGLALGGAGIVVKNVSGNIGSDVFKKKLLGDGIDLQEILSSILGLTGNNGIDLLNLINFFQKLQFLFIILLGYNLLILLIDSSIFENKIFNKVPKNIINLLIKYLNIMKKSSLILIICLYIFILISNLYSSHYLTFFILNLESIVELYFQNSN